jgi:hypothetical protein
MSFDRMDQGPPPPPTECSNTTCNRLQWDPTPPPPPLAPGKGSSFWVLPHVLWVLPKPKPPHSC